MAINVLMIILAILLLGMCILIHELGHFCTAKACGIRVNEFAIGMGPRLLHWGKGETTYSIRLLPIGGFCAMEGEDAESADTRSFQKRPKWQRFLVLIMGGVMNIVLGLVLMAVLLNQQNVFTSTTVSRFMDGAATQKAGVQVGDRFTRVNGYRVVTDRDLTFAFATADPASVDLTVERNGKELSFANVKFHSAKAADGRSMLQIDFYVKPIEKTPLTLLQKTFLDTGSVARSVWNTLGGLVTGKFGLKDVAGPVGTVQMIAQVATAGLAQSFWAAFQNVLFIVMVITVNLGIVNLLPIPAFDGGKVLFLLIEAIRRKPVSQKVQGAVEMAFFALVIVFMLVVTLSDVLRLTTGSGLGG